LQLKNILDFGWTWAEYLKISTGSGSQNMTVRSYLARNTNNWDSSLDHYHEITTPQVNLALSGI